MVIPVLLIGFNRPEFLNRRVEEIVQMNVPRLYISIDGGDGQTESLMKNALFKIERMDTKNTRIIINHHNSSLGLVNHITSAIDGVLSQYKNVIIVEDDIKLTKNFYINMISGFKTLDSRGIKGTIGAFSPLRPFGLFIGKNSWRNTRYFSCWGWGCSREVWADYKKVLNQDNFEQELKHSKTWQSLSKFQQRLWIHRFTKISKTPNHTWDIQFQYLSFVKSYIQLVPMFRFVDNEGFEDHRAAHTSGSRPRWMGRTAIRETIVRQNQISLFSKIFEKFLDSNTIAGDTRLIQIKNRRSKT